MTTTGKRNRKKVNSLKLFAVYRAFFCAHRRASRRRYFLKDSRPPRADKVAIPFYIYIYINVRVVFSLFFPPPTLLFCLNGKWLLGDILLYAYNEIFFYISFVVGTGKKKLVQWNTRGTLLPGRLTDPFPARVNTLFFFVKLFIIFFFFVHYK